MNNINIVFVLEKHYDEWSIEEDWWYGLHDMDINVVDEEDGTYSVIIYNVEYYFDKDGNEWGSTGSSVLDNFIIKEENEEKTRC